MPKPSRETRGSKTSCAVALVMLWVQPSLTKQQRGPGLRAGRWVSWGLSSWPGPDRAPADLVRRLVRPAPERIRRCWKRSPGWHAVAAAG